MFEPVRGGTRGGQAEFKWSDVSADKDRENYLGHSINAPTGRWQKNKDVHWYNRDIKESAVERAEEIRKIKEAEADALSIALGFTPAPKLLASSGADDLPSNSTSTKLSSARVDSEDGLQDLKREKRRKKIERREQKQAKKEKRRLERGERHAIEDRDTHSRRSRSPRRSYNASHVDRIRDYGIQVPGKIDPVRDGGIGKV